MHANQCDQKRIRIHNRIKLKKGAIVEETYKNSSILS